MMIEQGNQKWHRHSLYCTSQPVCAVVLALGIAWIPVVMLHRSVLILISDSIGQWILVAPLLLIAAVSAGLVFFFAAVARSMWFLLYSYRVLGSNLFYADPVFRRCGSIDLANVVRKREFRIVFSGMKLESVGYILETSNGDSIKLLRELDAWPAIERNLGNVVVESLPPRWWQLRK